MFAITPEADIGEAVVMSALCQKQTSSAAAEKTLDNMSLTYTKALSPVIALPTINVFISRVPS
jgi:hypothetical protein